MNSITIIIKEYSIFKKMAALMVITLTYVMLLLILLSERFNGSLFTHEKVITSFVTNSRFRFYKD